MSHKSFPPPNGALGVPDSSRSAFRAGMALWSSTRLRARMLQRVYRMSGSLVGPKLLPFRVDLTRSGWFDDTLEPHRREWRRWFGDFDEFALYRPSQTDRKGFAALLIRDGKPAGFVKARPDWDASAEVRAQRRLGESKTFYAPPVVGSHNDGSWLSVGMAALPPHLHGPRLRTSILSIVDEVSALIDLERTDGLPGHWVPMHGDMGPWNLRWMRSLGPVLFDWEHVSLGPPGADAVFHAIASRSTGIRSEIDIGVFPEAVEFWRDVIPVRFGTSRRDAALGGDMMRQLLRD